MSISYFCTFIGIFEQSYVQLFICMSVSMCIHPLVCFMCVIH